MPSLPSLRRAIAVAATVVALAGALVLTPFSPADGAPATAPTCDAPAGNARYVRFIYLEILGRCPDAAGRAYWTARLDAGLSPYAFAEAIDMSRQNLRANVVDLYSLLLSRAPSTTERDAGVAVLGQRHENASLTAALLASPEAYALHGTGAEPVDQDRTWLAFAYDRILDRAPDAKGEAYYLGRFAATGSTPGQRARVAMSLEHSAANALSWVKASIAEALGRPADPAGIAYWTAWLTDPARGNWQTFRLWTRQLSSPEAYRRAQTQPEA